MSRKYKFLMTLLAALIGLAIVKQSGLTQEPTFELPWFTTDGGGGRSSGNGLEVMGTAGQPDAGLMSGGNLSVSGGYWYRSAVTEQAADLSLTQVVSPGIAQPGETVTYTLTFRNEGTAVATGVTITNQKPTAVVDTTFESSGPNVSLSSSVEDCVWQVDDLAPGEEGTIVITGIVDPNMKDGGELVSTAVISADVDSFNGNNIAVAALIVQNTGYTTYLPIIIK